MMRSPAPGRPPAPVRPAGTAGRGGPPLLETKLAPPVRAAATVLRRRPTDLLTAEVQRSPLTLLSGPAGSGKTVLASSWRQDQGPGRPVAWLTLDGYDDDPAVFWSYVVEALARVGVPVSDVPAPVPGEPPGASLVPRLVADVAACARPVVLVLDDADHLTDRSIAAGLDLLLRHAGSRLRLVVCGRADPPLPLHRYRLDGTMSEIRGDQLAFTAEETRDLFAATGVPVTDEAARALCAEAEGWAVGLRLAAARLKQGTPPERLVTSLAHDDGSVAQYLFAEVLEGQPAGVRRVLLRTSVTPELWPDLVDRLSGRRNTRRVLTGLAHANAFVELSPGAPGGLRVHPLFREMLQAQLAYEHPADLAALHRTCAAWYAAEGRPRTAVAHAVAAEDWGSVSRLLVDDLLVPRLLVHGTDAALHGLRSLPPGVHGPEAAVVRTVVALAAGDGPDPADLAAAGRAAAEGGRLPLRLSAGLACLVADARTGVPPATLRDRAEDATALVAGLPEEEHRARSESTAVLAHVRSAAVLRTDAPTRQLLPVLRAAAATAHTAGSRRLRRRALGTLALLEALEGHLTRATQLVRTAEALATEDGAEETARDPDAATAQAWVHLRRYAPAESRDWLGRARARTRAAAPGAAGPDPLQAVLQAQHHRLRHEFERAEQALRPHLEGDLLPRWTAEQVVTEVVRLAVARGHVEDGLAILRDRGRDEPWSRSLQAFLGPPGGPVEVGGRSAGSLSEVVESAVVRAWQLLGRGDVPAAAEQLAGALDRARPELLRWPFVDTPPEVRRLLRTHPRLRGPGAWVDPSSGAVPAVPGERTAASAAEVVQQLSDRETEVLSHLAEVLSTGEIAAAMSISVNTVRTHIRSILRKLAVSRRHQAVRRARERGLL
ncbi:LuxR family transcriptional regulator [Geodermatophilus aquaeductus]|uniref:LuxR family transcriptional regulator, maltose regulon positive regulatory protein n=1 Tax=Geodermatophilus aquaeductus TaxID=1564161 RepID=A0A521E5Q4_9ACTN|nr:LuxR C-terminal-related transcriptional regulator [Geodermatophilus aquaeductus]SMO79273.1 LuxR family transcriptional regulator, maltose regulon positive regulatory protein [Geodermatophilus aquaeductus]